MGCAGSKEKRCRHCRTPYSPMPRSYSMHVVHPPQEEGDSYHVVALTSSTLGSLTSSSSSSADIKTNINAALAPIGDDHNNNDILDCTVQCAGGGKIDKQLKSTEFSVGLIEAKSWSNKIQEKIPKLIPRTPVRTPPGEPETINAWELMAGLEEDDDFYSNLPPPHRFRSFSFDITADPNRIADSPKLLNDHQIKPIWVQLTEEEEEEEEENPNSEFDPEVISTFRKSLNQLSPDHPFYVKPSSSDEEDKPPPKQSDKEKAIMYSTSLRGVRKTFEDCCHVRVILKGLGLRIDERDVSMHSGFKEELKQLLGAQQGFNGGGGLGLPRVFIGTKYIGDADEIRRMHEEGKLDRVFDECERAEGHGGDANAGGACDACGDVRFIPCETCSGSCKIYYEEEEEDDDDSEVREENSKYGFQRCPDCNENGLIRCPICCC